MGGLWQVAQFDQCRIEVDQASRFLAGFAGLDSWADDEQGDARGFLP